MSPIQSATNLTLEQVGLEEVRKGWGWFVGMGVILILLGTAAIGCSFTMTIASIFILGWFLIIGGVMEAIHAFWRERNWSGFFLDLLTGILYVVVGFMVVANPGLSAAVFTLLIAMFLMFGGIFRIVAALSVRYPNWGWVLLHGVVNLVLGILIWQGWPATGFWVIGLFIGIEMIFNGWTLVMLGLAAKNLPEQVAAEA